MIWSFIFTAIEKKGKGFLNNLELRGGKLNVKTYLTKSLGSEAPFLLGEVDTKQPKWELCVPAVPGTPSCSAHWLEMEIRWLATSLVTGREGPKP